jgi:hypothetical protein
MIVEQLYEFFTKGKGKQAILSMLNSPHEFLQLRTLWAVSNIPYSGWFLIFSPAFCSSLY